jgi:hypothetical protein
VFHFSRDGAAIPVAGKLNPAFAAGAFAAAVSFHRHAGQGGRFKQARPGGHDRRLPLEHKIHPGQPGPLPSASVFFIVTVPPRRGKEFFFGYLLKTGGQKRVERRPESVIGNLCIPSKISRVIILKKQNAVQRRGIKQREN